MLALGVVALGVVALGAVGAVAAAAGGPDYQRLRREHWAYQPLRQVEAPAVDPADNWPHNGVDRFIAARLNAAGLKPVGDAERATLARRVYFDLTGLPPTPKQLDDFASDSRPDAYERLVDSLLASPRFGERWGRHWLDVVRFGESVTLRGFVLPDTWRFRDYVIEAFNSDRPLNQFMQEHIAGDLMPADTVAERRRQMTGTTFLVMGNTNLEEQDKQQLRMDVVDEQLDTIGKAFLAQTIGCARCHDHKFDPIPTSDYYAMAGILRNAKAMEHANVSKWISVPLPEEPAVEAELKKHAQAIAALEAKLNKLGKSAKTAAIVAIKDVPGIVVDDEAAKKVGDWTHSTSIKTYVGDGYLHDDNSKKGERTLTFQPQIPKTGRYEVRLSYQTGKNRATNVPVYILSEDGERTITVDEKNPPAIDGRFVSLGTFTFLKDGQGYVLVSNEGTNGVVVVDAVQFLPADDAVVAGVASGKSGARDEKFAKEAKQLSAELKRLHESGPQREMIISVVDEKEMGDTQVNVRGSVHTLGATVPRGYLSCVPVKSSPKIPAGESGRLQLAQWLAAPDNPLPARVMANRVWHWLMGEGIVRTVDNFGTTGEPPSHPELLDYLARRFVEENWSVKHLVREIVLSRTYQLSSASDTKDLAADPENRLRWRMDRRRLDAECIRDAMLAISGELDLTMGGVTYKVGMGADYNFVQGSNRRSVYLPVFRNTLPELFQAFDFADPSMVVGRRNVSTVAPQALFLMNHPFPREQAEATAKRLLADGSLGDDDARLDFATRAILGRGPTADERSTLTGFVQSRGAGNRAAAWADVVHALFASTDFRYVN
jgi:hypothetical protein